MAEKKKSDKPKEPPESKFRRLANNRVNKALVAIGRIGNLASYAHTPQQGEIICRVLDAQVRGVSVRLTSPTKAETAGFKLPE